MPTAEGGPIPGRCLGVLYSAQASYGTAVTPASAIGITEWESNTDPGYQAFNSTGTAAVVYIKEGMLQEPFTINVLALQNKTFLQKAVRTSGELPWVTVGFGFKLDGGAPTQVAKQVQDCKIGSVSFRHEAAGPIRCDFTGIGGLVTALSSWTPAQVTDAEPWMHYEGTITRGGAAWACKSFGFDVDHGLTADAVIRGAAPSGPQATAKRLHDYLTERNETITGEFTRFARTQVNLQADAIAAADLVYTVTSVSDASDTMTLTFTGAKILDERWTGRTEDGFLSTCRWQCKTWTVA